MTCGTKTQGPVSLTDLIFHFIFIFILRASHTVQIGFPLVFLATVEANLPLQPSPQIPYITALFNHWEACWHMRCEMLQLNCIA